mgnify:CR=1 FL=1|tara:strand:+ start:413 stop:1462 length:1050 start_codon:yes stop_codon:yes gene_type:complete
MALQSSGSISISQIASEFGGSTPHSLSEYYGDGGVPSSGALSISDFYGTSNTVTLQVLLVGGGGAGGRGLNEDEEGELYTGGGGAGGQVLPFTLTASPSDASGVTFSITAGRGRAQGSSSLGGTSRLTWNVYSGEFTQSGGWRSFVADDEEGLDTTIWAQGGGGQGGGNNAFEGAGGASDYGSGRTSGASRNSIYSAVSGGNAAGVPNKGSGGGAGYSSGSNASNTSGGAGGAGSTSSITGSSVVYGGGGGGGSANATTVSGGSGGGGTGGSTSTAPTQGTDGLGGGGGGAGARTTGSWEEGGRGGGGCVYISSSVNPSSSSGVTITGSGPYLIALTAGSSNVTGSFTI